MRFVDSGSLAATLDVFESFHFGGQVMPNGARREIASFIASRFEQPRSYAGMPAPTARDFAEGARVFTGERVCSGAGTAHILGEEACRALLLLDVHTPEVLEPLGRATREMVRRIGNDDRHYGCASGRYCCNMCSVAVWRNLNACELNLQDERARHGLEVLRKARSADGRWKGYPFYYTLLALLEMTVAEAQDELEFAAGACAKLLGRAATRGEPYASRRGELMARVLKRCDRAVVEEKSGRRAKRVLASLRM